MIKSKYAYKKLQGWLISNDVTREDIADTLGSTVNTIGKKLNRKGTDFRLSEARKLHAEYGVPMKYFFEF